MREQRSDDEDTAAMRDLVLQTRAEFPHLVALPRHLGTFEYLRGEDPCPCESCRTFLCGHVARSWHSDERVTNLTWDLYWFERCPEAFADEPICDACLRTLAARTKGRTRRELLASEWSADVGQSLTWVPLYGGRGPRPKSRTVDWSVVGQTWPT